AVSHVVIQDRDHQRLRRWLVGRRAAEARVELELAVVVAAVAVHQVAVVALLPREHQAVAAGRGAHAAGADRLDGAGRRAAVERDEVVIVALLAALLGPVATDRLMADVARAYPARIDGARGAATHVHAVARAEVALLLAGDDLAVATYGGAPPA